MTTTLQTYPKYKPSGIDWLSDIPGEWNVEPLRYCVQENDKQNSSGQNSNVLSLSYGKVIRKEQIEGGLLPTSFSTYQVLDSGDIVMRLTDLQNDHVSLRTGLVITPGIITSAYLGLKVKKGRANERFLHWLLHSYDLQKVFYNMGGGVRQSIGFFDLKWLPILLPDENIQKHIADFLDEKTKIIDEMVAKKGKLIEGQRELTFSLVLGDNAKTKREIWGNVPDAWELQNARKIFMEVDVRNKPEEELLAVTQDRGVLPKANFEAQFVSPTRNEGQKLLEKNDFVISLRSFEGGIELSSCRGIVSPAYTILRLKDGYNTDLYQKYYKHLLKTPQFISYLNTIIMGIRDGKNISFRDFRDLILPVPPVNTIRSMLPEFEKYELLAHFFWEQRQLFSEYRSSLIYHAVTGKIRI